MYHWIDIRTELGNLHCKIDKTKYTKGLTSRDTAAQQARSLWARQENILRVISAGSFVNMLTLGNSISAFDELKRRVCCIMAVQFNSSRADLILKAESSVDRKNSCPKPARREEGQQSI